MATKEHKRCARGLIENLEFRVHRGPPIHDGELLSAHEYLLQSGFSPASDYFARLVQIRNRLVSRPKEPAGRPGKRNYGGEAAGRWMQVQFVYDHVILSTCYEGDFRTQHGRVKMSHRFNEHGRIDFVELKFLSSLHACLNGEIRKLLIVKDFSTVRKDWYSAEAHFLPILPRELIFLCEDIFNYPKNEVLAWLVNTGHRLIEELLGDLRLRPRNGGNSGGPANGNQMRLDELRTDDGAWTILERAASLDCGVDLDGSETAVVRYVTTLS
jgi:hypothetical protein